MSAHELDIAPAWMPPRAVVLEALAQGAERSSWRVRWNGGEHFLSESGHAGFQRAHGIFVAMAMAVGRFVTGRAFEVREAR